MPKDRYRAYHVEKAKGGIALTMTAGTALVSPDSPPAFGNGVYEFFPACAVVLATGATKPRDLPIEGRQLKGVHFAMEFLHGNTKALLDGKTPAINAAGKDVVVIGGGDTGTDCVGTSLRHGCKSVIQLEIMAKAPLTRAKDNPWPEWPKTYKVDYGQEEAAAKFGADPRVYLTTATKFVADAQGNLKEVHTVEVKWEKKQLREILLHPIDLGMGLPMGQRGRPVLAEGDTAKEILDRLQRCSDPFGTKIERTADGIVVRASSENRLGA